MYNLLLKTKQIAGKDHSLGAVPFCLPKHQLADERIGQFFIKFEKQEGYQER
ncbi:MAG: hypothetical protein H6Q14_1815 [Bacteroidetes bacterium]|jgi:hypothetical protein|nr:hypothetical protein [Bacteroidota bacterium]